MVRAYRKLVQLVALLSATTVLAAQRANVPVGGPHRYVFLIDTSIEGARSQMVLRQTIYDLLITSMFGQMRQGDTLNIWTYDDELHTDRIPEIKWDPANAEEWGNRTDELLKQEPINKRGDFKKVMAAILRLTQTSPSVTVFLVNDGSEPIKGTPFDRKLNAIYGQNAARLRRTKKPFVVTFLSQNGKMLAYRVSEGGSSIEIPAVPNRWTIEFTLPERATNSLTAQPGPLEEKPTAPPAIVDLANEPPKIDKAETNAPARRDLPAVDVPPPAVTVVPAATNREVIETASPPLPRNIEGDRPPKTEPAPQTIKPDSTILDEPSKPLSPRVEGPPANAPVTAATGGNPSPGLQTVPQGEPATKADSSAGSSSPLEPRVTPDASSKGIQSVGTPREESKPAEVATQPGAPAAPSPPIRRTADSPPAHPAFAQAATGRGVLLLAAVGLLFAALGLVFWLGRRTAGTGRGSLISHSLDEKNR